MEMKVYFIENLTLPAWVMAVWPRLVRERVRRGGRTVHCYVVDGSWFAMLLATFSATMIGVTVKKFAFRLIDIRDEHGLLMRLRLACRDLAEVQQLATEEPHYKSLLQNDQFPDTLRTVLAKSIAVAGGFGPGATWRALLLIHACIWKMDQDDAGGTPVLFIERRPWASAIAVYASHYGITIISVVPQLRVRAFLRHRLPPRVIETLRSWRYACSRKGWVSSLQRSSFPRLWSPQRESSASHHSGEISAKGRGVGARVAVEYLGQLNLNEPEHQSDLFFWQRSSLAAEDLMIIFNSAIDPVDDAKWAVLKEHGMAAVALIPEASTTPAVPVFSASQRLDRNYPEEVAGLQDQLEPPWIRQQIAEYQGLRSYWTRLFKAHDLRVFVTWYKYDVKHCAINDALRELGGVMAVYQRAYEPHPSVETTVATDILFALSPAGAEVERRSNSKIRYHVATGYIGDHRFSLVRAAAQAVRERLQRQGARQIIAFFDEGSTEDARWHTGHQLIRENYAFMLEKVLTEPWFGLLIKPKIPRTLRLRLGPVAELLERAEATGRCYVYDRGSNSSSHSPAEAASAADIAIHGHLCSATAGIEAALAGVPTLLLDREGWPVSPLYRLGVGRVVFHQWEELWEACLHHWAAPNGTSGIGDWSPMLDELDPFRDGRSAERIGTYIKWLIEGLRAGQDREAVMADAAERYCALWGSDKITSVQGNPALWLANPTLEECHESFTEVRRR